MGKAFAFIAGAVGGALVGAAVVLLLTPSSGPDMIQDAQERWELTKREAAEAMEERRRELETQFEIAKNN